MGLLSKLKSVLGLDGAESRGGSAPRTRDVDVTVEHEPDVASEEAVKGTDTGAGTVQGGTQGVSGVEETVSQEAATEDTTAESAEDTAVEETAAEDTTVEETAAEAESTSGADVPVDELNGIGPAYAGRLGEAGVETVADLAAADAEQLDAETDIGAGRIRGWIEQAREY
ncbi:MAG: helix-hairpin-helix domain-containing protein [Haloarculaceae archaeon]